MMLIARDIFLYVKNSKFSKFIKQTWPYCIQLNYGIVSYPALFQKFTYETGSKQFSENSPIFKKIKISMAFHGKFPLLLMSLTGRKARSKGPPARTKLSSVAPNVELGLQNSSVLEALKLVSMQARYQIGPVGVGGGGGG